MTSLTTTAGTTNPLAAAANTQSTGSGKDATSSTSLKALNQTFDSFLKLLTTQIKYQDPLKPMDTNEMTNQLVNFSQVEQQTSTNSKLDKLIGLQQTSGIGNALGYIGHTVEADGNKVLLSDGSGEIFYHMPERAESVEVNILDADGGKVRTLTLDGASGDHRYMWDGKDDVGGTLAPGAYSINVTANGGDGSSIIIPTTRTTGKVTGVDSSSGDTTLLLGALSVPASSVVQVR